MKIVLVFGTFDGLHPGHDNFFKQVSELGDNVIVCLTQDRVAQELKGKVPFRPFKDRKQALMNHVNVTRVLKGDLELRSFSAIRIAKPDVIAVGYDQDELKTAIQEWLDKYNSITPIIKLKAFEPEKYKSSLLRDK